MIKAETKAKQNITKQLKLDLKFFKSEVKTMEQLKTSLSSWYYKEKMTSTIIKNINSDKYDLKQAKEVISKRLNKFYDNKLNKVLADIENVKKVDKSACRWGQCMIDWNRNATWGNCPKGSYRNGHAFTVYGSVTGCGYDKLSTLTANMFNDDKYLMTKKQDLQTKYDNLQAKYKTLAGRHRQYLMQKTNEKKRLEKLKADNKKIISELSNKIYELSNDDDLIKNDDFIKRTIKEQKHD
jgi:hypothetical protein